MISAVLCDMDDGLGVLVLRRGDPALLLRWLSIPVRQILGSSEVLLIL